jgi:hypothetical protein
VWRASLTARIERMLATRAFVLVEAGSGLTMARVTGELDFFAPLFAMRGAWLALGVGAGAAF